MYVFYQHGKCSLSAFVLFTFQRFQIFQLRFVLTSYDFLHLGISWFVCTTSFLAILYPNQMKRNKTNKKKNNVSELSWVSTCHIKNIFCRETIVLDLSLQKHGYIVIYLISINIGTFCHSIFLYYRDRLYT